MLGVSVGTTLELVAAVALIVGAIILYRRRGRDDPRHGSQGAVLLLIVGVIMLIHGLGLLDYRPSPSEIRP
ncbi:hypothetical protein [Sphingomonas sp.]|uniref:hypothetical protein n=1 Tax=Sphingomonas sp. TaxID=28214 RepID=UPI0017944594|nr:hypothetical protein [Sphingomonas sp.]MBA3512588.1 hypothetical protein [Sphingomonas sp.]